MDFAKRKLDVVAIAILAIVVGAMLTSSEFYGGWAGRICSVIVFIIAVLLGWRITNKIKGATLVLNYLLVWAILFYLQLVGFNLIEGVVATAISHVVFVLVLVLLWYFLIWRKIKASSKAA